MQKNAATSLKSIPWSPSISTPPAATSCRFRVRPPVPDRILRAMSLPTIDHRGVEFAVLGKRVLSGMQRIFQTKHPVVIYPASGTGAWEAALANTLSPGDAVLMYETGHFASLWNKMATRLGLQTEFLGLPGVEGWRRGVQADLIEERLRKDTDRKIKAVCVVHNETSTGVTSDIPAVRRAIQQVDLNAAIIFAKPMTQLIDESLWQRRLWGVLFLAFALLALILASVGIYGVMSYMVAQRTREIGLRIALGAQSGDVLRLVLGHSLAWTLAGVILGIAGALGLLRFLGTLLYGVTASDPTVLAVASLSYHRRARGQLSAGTPGRARRSCHGAPDGVTGPCNLHSPTHASP